LIYFTAALSINSNAQQADSSFVLTETLYFGVAVKKEVVYKIKPWIDLPVTVVFDAWSYYGMSVIYGRDPIPESEILALDKNNVNKLTGRSLKIIPSNQRVPAICFFMVACHCRSYY
jgi:hypothetical protein